MGRDHRSNPHRGGEKDKIDINKVRLAYARRAWASFLGKRYGYFGSQKCGKNL